MADTLTYGTLHEHEKEIVNILIDSDLYLEMEPVERLRLIHHIIKSFFESPVG
jgi:hypothetical protein